MHSGNCSVMTSACFVAIRLSFAIVTQVRIAFASLRLRLKITLVNTQIFGKDISTVLGYIGSADAENGLTFAELL